MTTAFNVNEPEHGIIIELVEILKPLVDPIETIRTNPEIQKRFAFLEDIARQERCVYSLFDFKNYRYLFHTQTLFSLIGLELDKANMRWDPSFTTLLSDDKPVMKFLSLRKQFESQCNLALVQDVQFVVCGCQSVNLKGIRQRGIYRSRPMAFDDEGHVTITFDCISGAKHLMIPEAGYWIRLKAGQRVAHWHSHTDCFVQKDIISARELELLSLWKAGFTLSEIADKTFVTISTVKNHLANIRQRFLARDNSSLVQICIQSGILAQGF